MFFERVFAPCVALASSSSSSSNKSSQSQKTLAFFVFFSACVSPVYNSRIAIVLVRACYSDATIKNAAALKGTSIYESLINGHYLRSDSIMRVY